MMKRFKIPEVDRIFRQGLSLEGIIRCIVSIAGFAPEFTEEYCQGLMSYYSRKDLAIDSTSELSDRLIWYFLPQKFSYVGSPPNPGEAAGWDFFLGQMAWEVWGLNAQFFWLEKPSLLQHLENLSSALVKAPLSAQQRIFSRGLEQQISTLQGRIHTEVS